MSRELHNEADGDEAVFTRWCSGGLVGPVYVPGQVPPSWAQKRKERVSPKSAACLARVTTSPQQRELGLLPLLQPFTLISSHHHNNHHASCRGLYAGEPLSRFPRHATTTPPCSCPSDAIMSNRPARPS